MAAKRRSKQTFSFFFVCLRIFLPPLIENKKEMQTVHLVLSLFYELLKKEKEDELVKRKEKRNEDGNRLKAFPKRQTDHL